MDKDEQGFTAQDRAEYPYLVALEINVGTRPQRYVEWLLDHRPNANWVVGLSADDQGRAQWDAHFAKHGSEVFEVYQFPEMRFCFFIRFEDEQEAMFFKLGCG